MRIILGLSLALSIIFAATARAKPSQEPKPQAQAGGGVEASPLKFRVLRSVSGTKGVQTNGTYVIQDPRTIFYLGQDHQVIIYFEWEGPLGLHRFEGIWKNPDGKITAISDFDYEAKQNRFGGYWQLFVGETTQTGLWTLEARVDGEVTGAHTFQILGGTNPKPVETIPAILTPAQIYQQAQASTVTIEKRNQQGEVIGSGLGFLVAPRLVLTAFQVIDGAGILRLKLPEGRDLEVSEIASWNRRQDWALVKVPVTQIPPLPIAKPNSDSVGDRCLFLDAAGPGNRVIVETILVGKNNNPGWGDRINFANAASEQGMGSALLNEYGEVFGIVGGSLFPGASSLEGLRVRYATNWFGAGAANRGAMATPLSLVSLDPDKFHLTTLEQMARTGQFVPALLRKDNIVSGSLVRALPKGKEIPSLIDDKFEYSRADASAFVSLIWSPREKVKGLSTIRVYDLDNRLLSEGRPIKVKMSAGETKSWSSELHLAGLRPGIYRVDLTLDGNPLWRAFFRINE
jgi:hypothetical protein